MYFAAPVLLLAASASALAYGPPNGGQPSGPPGGCLSPADASYLVNGYVDHVATKYDDAFAQKLIANGANVTSQSVLALMGKTGADLQGPTFVGKPAILASEKNKAFALDIKVLGIDAVGCNSVAWRWLGTPNGGTPVRAISIFHATKDPSQGWQIAEIFGEFNSLTWGQDIGAKCTLPGPPPS